MSYQEVYNGLNKKASNEQIKKLASIIGMKKKAQETEDSFKKEMKDAYKTLFTGQDKLPSPSLLGRFRPSVLKAQRAATKQAESQKIPSNTNVGRHPHYYPEPNWLGRESGAQFNIPNRQRTFNQALPYMLKMRKLNDIGISAYDKGDKQLAADAMARAVNIGEQGAKPIVNYTNAYNNVRDILNKEKRDLEAFRQTIPPLKDFTTNPKNWVRSNKWFWQ